MKEQEQKPEHTHTLTCDRIGPDDVVTLTKSSQELGTPVAIKPPLLIRCLGFVPWKAGPQASLTKS